MKVVLWIGAVTARTSTSNRPSTSTRANAGYGAQRTAGAAGGSLGNDFFEVVLKAICYCSAQAHEKK